ncbi:MAG: hypothetical protein HYS69_11510 [candidate division NC10 bacterium]|nr:hypothetical protein [candidate division NC10 bacterium]
MQTQAPEIDGCILVNDGPEGAFQPGKIVTIQITEAHPYDLVGCIVGAA